MLVMLVAVLFIADQIICRQKVNRLYDCANLK